MANNINDYIQRYSAGIAPKTKAHKFRWLGDYAINVIAYGAIIFFVMIFLGFICHLAGC